MNEKTDIWMPLYIGDYLADTAMLTVEQSGCYLHWLMGYWRTGPLPDNLPALVQMGKLNSPDATSIAQALLTQFFYKNGDGRWHQKRMDEELARWNAKKQKAKEKAAKAATARWNSNDAPSIPPSNASSTPQAMLELCPSPLPSNTKRSSSKNAEMLYKAYPRHTGKIEAIKAIEKVLHRGHDPQWLLDRVNRFAELKKAEDQKFIPYPATWFNAGHYFDDELEQEIKAKPTFVRDDGSPVVPQ